MKEYIKQNPIKITMFVLSSFGFLITFSYFWYIEYLPEMTLDEFGPVFIGNALIGGLITLVTISIFTYSGLVWPNNKESSPIASLWIEKDRVSGKKIFVWYGLPVLPLPIATALIFINGWVSLVLMIGLLVYLTYLYKIKYTPNDRRDQQFVDYLSHLFNASILYIPISFYIYLFVREVGDADAIEFGLLIISSVLLIWFANILIIAKPQDLNKHIWWLVVGSVTFVLFISLTRSWHVVPAVAMRVHGIGQINDYMVSAKDEICLILPEEVILKNKVGANPELTICTLKPLLLLSTLGDSIYLEYASNDNVKYRFTIPKTYLVNSLVDKKAPGR